MTKTDEIERYQLSIDELRRMYDTVFQAYNSARTKVLTFVGGSFALLAYLYGGGDLFIPTQIYGVIFYFIGLISFITAISILFLAMHPVIWQLPTERKVHKEMKFKSHMSFLKYIQNEYVEALDTNMAYCEKKQKYLNLSFPLLVIGAILLLVIKNFS